MTASIDLCYSLRMCLMAFAIAEKDGRPELPFVFAANRDEFYKRSTEPAHTWRVGATEIWAGRDLEAGGTWLAIAADGRFATITNYRDPQAPLGSVSRGALVTGFFESLRTPLTYLEEVDTKVAHYSPFNLIVGDLRGPELWYYTSVTRELRKLGPGLYGLSNATLDEPWPKVTRIKGALKDLLASPDSRSPEALEARLFALLKDRERAPDAELPQTGVSLEWERLLSSIFIESPDYGTRSSTVIVADANGRVRYSEQLSPEKHY